MSTSAKRSAVLVVNLGTPDAPTPAAIRAFLAEFLSDRRVVALPRLLWWPLLYGLILPFRPARLAEKYRLVWTSRGSPLLEISRQLAARLQAAVNRPDDTQPELRLAMRYGAPRIADAISELSKAGVTELVVLPLYPQYSATTTASVIDAVNAELQRRSWSPALRFVERYHDHPAYIGALAASVRAHWLANGQGDHLLMSFHGIPEKNVAQGDPYARECHETARLLAQALQLSPAQWSIAFQSRLGRAPWIKPYTDRELPRLARGVRTLDVICPGFAADCLETLEEVAVRYAAQFTAAGGASLRYIPALNDSPAHVTALAEIIADKTGSPPTRG